MFLLKYQEWDAYNRIDLKSKVTACAILIKNSLSKGNTEVTLALKETKHPKDKTFDKIFSMMLENCVENIEERTRKEVKIILNKILRYFIPKRLLYGKQNTQNY